MATASFLVSEMNLLYRLARTRPGRFLTGRIFTHMGFAIPAKRLRETDTLMAFHHPKPAYPFHVVIVPKKAVGTLADLDPADTVFLSDLVAAVQSLVKEFHLEGGYRLIVNGGKYQDFPQLHFHLTSDAGTSHDTPLHQEG